MIFDAEPYNGERLSGERRGAHELQQVRDNLSPYLDQVLSQEEVNLVEKHLESALADRN